MRRPSLPHGLRPQLTLAIAGVTAIAVGASFLAVYADTGSRLRAQIDVQLRTQAAEWRQSAARGPRPDLGGYRRSRTDSWRPRATTRRP